MFDRLVASRYRHTDRTGVPSSTVAVLTHAGVCAAAVLGTLRPHGVSKAEGPPIIISWPQPREEGSHADPLDRIPGPTAAPIDVPTQAPIGLPPIDPGVPFDPKLLPRGSGDAPGGRDVDGAPDGPWSFSAVDDPPGAARRSAARVPGGAAARRDYRNGGGPGCDRHAGPGGASLPGARELVRRLRDGRTGVCAGCGIPTGTHPRPGGAGAGALADRFHAEADSLTGEPVRRLVAQ